MIPMSKLPYKGYLIKAAPYQRAESKRWVIKIYIYYDAGDKGKFRCFRDANTFMTKNEAIHYCVDFGRCIIDRKIENCTVDDLVVK
jgi:hypothetical protein